MPDNRRFGARFALLTALIAVLTGCVAPSSSIQQVTSLSQLNDDTILVIGEVQLVPALASDEQLLDDNYEEFRNTAILIVDEDSRQPEDDLTFGGLRRSIRAPLGETFFVAYENRPFFITKSWLVMDARIRMVAPDAVIRPGNAPLHGVFRVNVQPEDRAVYIGTIRYHRDAFFSTVKVEVIDQFAQAQEAFQHKFGGRLSLRKELAVPLHPE